jgi:hypothetical protein
MNFIEMKKKSLILICSILSGLNVSHGTQITFLVELDELVVSGSSINQANSAGLTASAFFVETGSDFTSFTTNAAFSGLGSDITLDQLSDIRTFLSENNSFNSGSDLGFVPDAAPDNFGVIRETENAGAAGFHAFLFLHTAADLNSLGEGDSLGLIGTSFATLASGTEVVGFNTTNSWDTFLVGMPGSLTFASVVPEPSLYSAIAGLLALGFASTRRRRA